MPWRLVAHISTVVKSDSDRSRYRLQNFSLSPSRYSSRVTGIWA
ncbi:hypothetical protein CKA32_003514 [Geitlerinema sp. FC II]|nr:hypothetical protein CKA32_003514 [Geitlerinema sp. FC II]